jgi:hypothetical protein
MSIFIFLIALPLTSIYGVGQGEWIVNYRIEDLETGQLYIERDFQEDEFIQYVSLFDGSELNVTIQVDIATTVSHVNLRLATILQSSSIQDRYWQLHSKDYEFQDYNPAQKYVEFTQVKGTFSISCYGKVPNGITQDIIDGYVLHKPEDYVLIRLTSPSGELLDQVRSEVIDAEIDEYRNLMGDREDKLVAIKNSGVAPGYVELFENVLDEAEVQAERGFVDEAITMLDLLTVSQEPISSTVENIFLPVMVVLVVAVVVVGFLYMRTRSKSGYILSVIEDQIKDLEGLTLRASKIDRNISSRLDSMKERLKKLVWT